MLFFNINLLPIRVFVTPMVIILINMHQIMHCIHYAHLLIIILNLPDINVSYNTTEITFAIVSRRIKIFMWSFLILNFITNKYFLNIPLMVRTHLNMFICAWIVNKFKTVMIQYRCTQKGTYIVYRYYIKLRHHHYKPNKQKIIMPYSSFPHCL